MRQIKVVAVTALIAVGIVLLLENPEVLTDGASATWSHSAVLPDHFAVRSYALDVLDGLTAALGLAAVFVTIRRRIRQRSIWRRRESMKSIDGGKRPRPENAHQHRGAEPKSQERV